MTITTISGILAENDLRTSGVKKKIVEKEITNETKKKSQRYLYSAVIIVNILSFAVGISLTWSSPVIPKLSGRVETDEIQVEDFITKEEESWIGSLLTLGAACGPYIAGILSNRIGRKLTLIICGGMMSLTSYLILAFAQNVTLYFVARFLGGFAMGSTFCTLPNYVGEIVEPSNRGALSSVLNIFLTCGLFFSYVVGPYVSITVFSLICAVFPALFIILFSFYPETPYYLIQKQKYEKAQDSLQKLRTKTREDVQTEFENIKKTLEEKLVNEMSIIDIFKSPKLVKALSLSFGLVLFQQFSGINVVLFYTQTIFQSTGSGIPSTYSSMLIGGAQLIPSAITFFVIDRAGRRPTLLFSSIGMLLSQTPLGVYFYLKDNGYDVSAIYWLPVTSLVVFIVTYRIGYGPLPWVIMAELFPSSIKSAACTFTTSFCYVLGFIITRYFHNLAQCIGMGGGFWIFACFSILGILFVYFHLPETKKKTFQEINLILYGNKSDLK